MIKLFKSKHLFLLVFLKLVLLGGFALWSIVGPGREERGDVVPGGHG